MRPEAGMAHEARPSSARLSAHAGNGTRQPRTVGLHGAVREAERLRGRDRVAFAADRPVRYQIQCAMLLSTAATVAAGLHPRIYPLLSKWQVMSLSESAALARQIANPARSTECLLRLATEAEPTEAESDAL